MLPEKPSEESEAGDPAEQSGLAAEDTRPSASSLQELLVLMKTSVSVTLPPSRSPENTTFQAGRDPSGEDLQGGSGEEPNMAHREVEPGSPEGSSGGGWPEPTDGTPPTGRDEAEESVKTGLSPHHTFTVSSLPESSSPTAQEVSPDGPSSSNPAVTEEPEDKEELKEKEQEEEKEQQLSSIRISGGFSALLLLPLLFLKKHLLHLHHS